jgi:hypothetical protein
LVVATALIASPITASAQEDAPPDAVIQAALDAASVRLDVPSDTLTVVMTAQHDWPDSSLGCPEPGIAYSQIVAPGYIVTIDTDDQASEVEAHTDRGSRAVICSSSEPL